MIWCPVVPAGTSLRCRLLSAPGSRERYPLTEQQVINMVNEAFESEDFEATKDLLDECNNLESPGFCD
jgi:hypothetical protein